jgi:hypothetical protein
VFNDGQPIVLSLFVTFSGKELSTVWDKTVYFLFCTLFYCAFSIADYI